MNPQYQQMLSDAWQRGMVDTPVVQGFNAVQDGTKVDPSFGAGVGGLMGSVYKNLIAPPVEAIQNLAQNMGGQQGQYVNGNYLPMNPMEMSKNAAEVGMLGTVAGGMMMPKNSLGMFGGKIPKSLDNVVSEFDKRGIKNFISERPDSINLSKIIIPEGERGKGLGSEAMETLLAYADSVGKRVDLTPSKDFGASSVKRLNDFYSGQGFVKNSGKNKDYSISDSMYREPKEGLMKGTDDFLPQGSPERAENFKNWFGDSSIAYGNDKPQTRYHQTSKDNAESIYREGFDTGKVGARAGDNLMPDGVFLKDNSGDIGLTRGEVEQIPLHASLKNPLQVNDRDELLTIMKADEQYSNLFSKGKEIDNHYNTKIEDLEKISAEAYKREYYDNTLPKTSRDNDDKIDVLLAEWKLATEANSAQSRARVTEYLKGQGYDGLTMYNDAGSMGRKVATDIVFDPRQVKSPDNIGTYDPTDKNIFRGGLMAPIVPQEER